MMSPEGRRKAILLAVALLAGCWLLARDLEPKHAHYVQAQMPRREPGQRFDPLLQHSRVGNVLLDETPFHAIVPAVLGVRELVASLLWIQADSLFHRGEYGPIMDLIYRIVAIDPHQIDVYATGAWHLAYNFMDKRMILDGIRFLEDGIRNNPDVYDLYFELGYTHQDKTKDFLAAIDALSQAVTKGTSTGDPQPPAFVFMQLAHALERAGHVDEAAEQWRRNVEVAVELEKQHPDDFKYDQLVYAARHNYYLTLRRRNERRAAELELEGNGAEALKRWEDNIRLAQEMLGHYPGHDQLEQDLKRAQTEVARLRAGKINRTPPPETRLEFTVRRKAPREIEVAGTINVPLYSRVRVILRDKDYERLVQENLANAKWRHAHLTYEFENVQVRDGKFSYTFRLNRDPADMGRDFNTIYPLKSEEYEITVQFDPRLQALFIQDRYGWNGERLYATDGLKEDHTLFGIVEGRRVPRRYLEKRVILRREEIE